MVELAITDAANVTPINLPSGAKLTDSLGVLGFSGLCAYFGLTKEADIKAGDCVLFLALLVQLELLLAKLPC
jgi:NADPH-dependent curcumin reductase CurA